MFHPRASAVATSWLPRGRLPVILSRLVATLVAVGLLFAAQTLATPERAAAADPGYHP
ncbi:hypothetical protein [Streptomyces pseudovenezuelae]|uniref:Uncharacterized protein n=1 Tax=Streptomyces pseudovenezuelae TaxID=67350 RepID=A0ABZ1WMI7_9ACTN|nr:hypothetical protein [Streptomyces pseudovenezuelae]